MPLAVLESALRPNSECDGLAGEIEPHNLGLLMMHSMLHPALLAARAAGQVILDHVERIDTLTIDHKERNDFVSDVDRKAEAKIIEMIKSHYPDHAILAEESGLQSGNEYQWIIDPLDGTTNFLYGLAHYAVSIALQVNGGTELAVIFDPSKDEMFAASYGGGAWLNDRRIQVSGRPNMHGALIATGIPFRPHQDLDRYLLTLRAIVPDTAGIRRPGAAALDLAYVGAGRFDGFWEFALKPWDIAAGLLIVSEAGGLLGTPGGGDGDCLRTGDIVCGTPAVYAAIQQRLGSLL